MSSHIPLPKEKHSKSKLFATVSSLSSKKKEHIKCIEAHPFNHRLSIIVDKKQEADTQRMLAECIGEYYNVKTLKPTDLIDPSFIREYVSSKGKSNTRNSLVALSLGTRIDVDDVFAIDGNGQLIMSLCKDTYQVLGLTGRQSQFPLERGSRFVVTVDLLADCMDPETKYFRRLHSRLHAVFGDQEFEFAIGVYAQDTGKALNLDIPGVTACMPQVVTMSLLDVDVPDLARSDLVFDSRPDGWNEEAQDVFEWIGLAAAGADAVTQPAGQTADALTIRTYHAPAPTKHRDLAVLSVEGMLSAKAISQFAQKIIEIQRSIDPDPDHVPLFLCVWGYDDAPVSWGSSEHGFLTSGENMYAHVYLPQIDKCVAFQACGPWDSYS
ncbi:hypothetical protein LPJ72_004866 [Coemansia sp. Benny D160-2]|nr:hypothetical protein LPJ72_004866 [Coemansia sp. Benny D160-2]